MLVLKKHINGVNINAPKLLKNYFLTYNMYDKNNDESFLVHEEIFSFKSKIYYYGNKYRIETVFKDENDDKCLKIITQNNIRDFNNPRKNIPQEYYTFFDSFGNILPEFYLKIKNAILQFDLPEMKTTQAFNLQILRNGINFR